MTLIKMLRYYARLSLHYATYAAMPLDKDRYNIDGYAIAAAISAIIGLPIVSLFID